MFVERLSEKTNAFVDYCDNYHGQNICLFGAGQGAYRIYMYLKSRNIPVSKIAVNANYVDSANKRILESGGYIPKAESFESVMSSDAYYDVVVTFAGWDTEYFKRFRKIGRLFNLDVFSGLPEEGSLSAVEYVFYETHDKELETIYQKMSDEKSRDCFLSYINQRISGKYEYAVGLVDKTQYFDDSVYKLGGEEVFVDCGAFDGMDTKIFFEKSGVNSGAILFEPDPNNILRIKSNLKEYSSRCHVINKGVLDKDCVLRFKSDGTIDSKIDENGDIEVHCSSIDGVIGSGKATLIKMDIEGSELRALKGAIETIKRNGPKLAICIYHKPEDVIDIPMLILKINPDYKFFVRRYDRLCIETVLYAVLDPE